MFKSWRDDKGDFNYQGTISAEMDNFIPQMLKKAITEELAEAWIKEHGADLLDKIAPEEVEKAIKTLIAERIVK